MVSQVSFIKYYYYIWSSISYKVNKGNTKYNILTVTLYQLVPTFIILSAVATYTYVWYICNKDADTYVHT